MKESFEGLSIIQEIDTFLEDEKLSEIAERAATAYPSDRNAAVIKGLLHIVFGQLKAGIVYVYERYGVVADHFTIEGDTCIGKIGQYAGYTVRYMPDHDCITTDFESLGVMCAGMPDRKVSLVPLEYWPNCRNISMQDALFLAGVEEAHHACHIKTGGPHTDYQTEEEYRNDPAEQAAGKVVRQAIREKKIPRYYCKDGEYFPCDDLDE